MMAAVEIQVSPKSRSRMGRKSRISNDHVLRSCHSCNRMKARNFAALDLKS